MIHFLVEGRSLCHMPGVPGEWPPDHKWARLEEWPDVRAVDVCPHCRGEWLARKEKMQTAMSIKRARVRVMIEFETGETFESNGAELVLSAHSYEKQLRSAAETEAGSVDLKVRDALLGYGQKAEA